MSGRRVLVLAPFPPRLDGQHGGSRAVARLAAGLADRSRVALAYLRATDEPPADPELAAACDRVLEVPRPGISTSSLRPWPRALAVLGGVAEGMPLWVAARRSADFARRVRELAAVWRPEVLQAEFTAMGQYLGAVEDRRVRRVVTVHEPGAPAAWERVLAAGGWERAFWRADARRWERFEAETLHRADAAVVYTGRDRAETERVAPGTPAVRIPLAVPVPGRASDPLGGDPPALLFVGSFVHPPNLDAALHLVRDLFPRLRARFPALELFLVGDGPPDALRAAAGPGVTVTGWVPELAPYLDRASLVVAPVRRGGGMRVKVAEALAAGKATVGSALAFEGLDVQSGTHALVASAAEDFVAAAAALLADPGRRARLAASARAWALANLGPQRTAEAYLALYERLLAGEPRGAEYEARPGKSPGAVA
ncbi:MAG TPA: glycosyltransferase [Longimicrobiaceae bacterium]|nr:glycosyltransferase [Longimicrobiaceae bacterium]